MTYLFRSEVIIIVIIRHSGINPIPPTWRDHTINFIIY